MLGFIVTILLLVFVFLGFLLGLTRGVKRATLRLGLVVLSAVLAFFLAKNLLPMALAMPASSIPELSLMLEVTLPADATVKDALTAFIQGQEMIADLANAAPTLFHFVIMLPQALIAEVLFVLLFFVIKFLLGFIQVIINLIFFRRKGSHLLGGLVGAVQGLFCALVLLVPVFGLLPLLDQAVAAAEDIPTDDQGNKVDIALTIDDFNESFYAPIKSDPSYVVLEATGVRHVCTEVFFSLSEVADENGQSVCVFRDIYDTAPVLVKLLQLQGISLDSMTTEDIAVLKDAVQTMSESRLISATLSEVVINVSRALVDGEDFMGISFPEGMDPSTSAFMHDTFDTLANVPADDLIADLDKILDTFGVMVEYDMLSAFSSDAGDGAALNELLKDTQFTTDLLTAMTDSVILSPVAVSAVNNYGIVMIADALSIENPDELKVSNKYILRDMTAAEREAEIATLASIIGNAFALIEDMEGGITDMDEQLHLLPTFGSLLNSMSRSQLLGRSATGVMNAFLDMEAVTSFLAESAITTIKDKITDGSINYEATFSSIAAAYNLAKATNITDDTLHNPEELANAIEDLFQSIDETSAEILKEAVSEEFLGELGLPEGASNTASAVLDAFFDEAVKASTDENIDFEKEADAIQSMMTFLSDASENPSEVVEEENLTSMLDSVLASVTITNTLISSSEDVDLSEQFTPDQLTSISDFLDSYSNSNVEEEKLAESLDALRLMLGITRP